MADGSELSFSSPPRAVFLNEYLPEQLQPFSGYIEGAVIAITIFVFGWILSKWANRFIHITLGKRLRIDEALSKFFGNIAQYSILAISFIAALGQVGVQTTSLVAVFASAGIAAGLALQGSLSNFASGVMILVFRPFDLGDLITVGTKDGYVQDIGIFATTIENLENDKIIVPNGKILNDIIINHTASRTRRATVTVGVAYDSRFNEVLNTLNASAIRTAGVLASPPPLIAFVDMAASSINFDVHVWCNHEDYIRVLNNLRTSIFKDLNAAGIEIPFQQVVLHNSKPAT